MIVVPSDPRSKGGDDLCCAGAGSGAADTQHATRSTSGMGSGQADCAATGATDCVVFWAKANPERTAGAVIQATTTNSLTGCSINASEGRDHGGA